MADGRVRMVLEGLRRFAFLTIVVIVGTALVSLVLGLLLGSGARRSVSVGLYLAGSLFVVLAFFVASRPPAKADRDDGDARAGMGGMLMTMSGTARFTTPEERRDTQAISWVLAFVGIAVVLAGAFVDGRHTLI